MEKYYAMMDMLAKVEQDIMKCEKITDQMYRYQLIRFLATLDKKFQPYINSWFMLELSQQLSNSI